MRKLLRGQRERDRNWETQAEDRPSGPQRPCRALCPQSFPLEGNQATPETGKDRADGRGGPRWRNSQTVAGCHPQSRGGMCLHGGRGRRWQSRGTYQTPGARGPSGAEGTRWQWLSSPVQTLEAEQVCGGGGGHELGFGHTEPAVPETAERVVGEICVVVGAEEKPGWR